MATHDKEKPWGECCPCYACKPTNPDCSRLGKLFKPSMPDHCKDFILMSKEEMLASILLDHGYSFVRKYFGEKLLDKTLTCS
jgi:hypothetical protein